MIFTNKRRSILNAIVISTLFVLFTSSTFSQDSKENFASDCRVFPYGQGCAFINLGLIIDSSDAGLIWGGALSYGYFFIDRLAARLNLEGVVFPNQNQYEAGPDLLYFFGPFFGWVFKPGYGVRKLWVTGSFTGNGLIHGPILGIEMRLSERFMFGIEVFYRYTDFEGLKSEEARITPSISFAF